MSLSKSSSPNQQRKIPWYSVCQFALSALAVFYLLSGAFGLVVFGVTSTLVDAYPGADPLAMLMMAAGMFAGGLLVLPSAGYALRHILGREDKEPQAVSWGLRPTLLIFLFPLTLLLGYLVIDVQALSWLVIPPLHVAAIGLPVLWVLYLGVRDLPLGSPQRRWGVFGGGLVLSPLVVIVAEILALIGFVILGVTFILGQPELIQELSNLAEWISVSGPNEEAMLERLGPYLTKPGVIFAVIVFAAIIVPLIEEALKPIGVWLLAGRNISPAEGFAAGALSGAGFALFESLAISVSAEDWIVLVVGRVGTAMLHILTTALTGWALALAWGRSRYLNLGLTYLGVILIHGTWNGLALLYSFDLIAEEFGGEASNVPLPWLAEAAPYVLGVMAAASLLAIIALNRRFARMSEAPDTIDGSSVEPQIPEKEYNPPEFAPAHSGETEGEELHNDGVDIIPD